MFDWYALILVVVMVLVNLILRFSPFIIYAKKDRVSPTIKYFGEVLPFAITGMLLVYCLKDISFTELTGWLPTLIGVVVTAGLQIWRRNSIISVLAGTVVYMILINVL